MRNALELSIITAPAAVTASRICFDTPAPQLNSAMSTPSKLSGVISCTVSSPAGTWPQPSKASFLPADRAEASAPHLGRREVEIVQHAQKLRAPPRPWPPPPPPPDSPA